MAQNVPLALHGQVLPVKMRISYYSNPDYICLFSTGSSSGFSISKQHLVVLHNPSKNVNSNLSIQKFTIPIDSTDLYKFAIHDDKGHDPCVCLQKCLRQEKCCTNELT